MALFVGVMSGTSLDGVDVAAVEFGGSDERPEPVELVAFDSVPFEPELRDRIAEACRRAPASELCRLHFELGRRLAEAVLRSLEEAGIPTVRVRAIGSHGQTVWHEPGDAPGVSGSTLQIGEAAVIAEITGCPVVADFRVRDVAAGGQGAPLTAYFDRLLLTGSTAARAIQNLGGMGNLTALPVSDSDEAPLAFDTGPGVALIDGCVRRLTRDRASFDRDGELAAAGPVSAAALDEWLADPFFDRPPPRSTGRERFGEEALEAWMERHRRLSDEAMVSTLTELTARSIARSLRWVPFPIDEVYLCGGGARNRELRRRLERALAPRSVRRLKTLGWDGDAREAVAFALLARQHLLGFPASPAWATGAAGPRILGKLVTP